MLGWVDLHVGYIPEWFTCLWILTHPSSNYSIANWPGVEHTTSLVINLALYDYAVYIEDTSVCMWLCGTGHEVMALVYGSRRCGSGAVCQCGRIPTPLSYLNCDSSVMHNLVFKAVWAMSTRLALLQQLPIIWWLSNNWMRTSKLIATNFIWFVYHLVLSP